MITIISCGDSLCVEVSGGCSGAGCRSSGFSTVEGLEGLAV